MASNQPSSDMPGYYGSVNEEHMLPGSYGDSLPQQPPPYEASGGQSGPSPPPPYPMEKLAGYENVTFDDAILRPPTDPDVTEEPVPERIPLPDIPNFTDEEDVREAVTRLVAESCCYGSAVASEMEITDITMNSAFRYILETFGEKRQSAWRFVGFTGQRIDGSNNGPAPAPWDVPVRPGQYFQNAEKRVEVPHTAFVKPCHICVGNGRVRCGRCQGRGRVNHESAAVPDRCSSCSGKGQQKCGTCSGKGNLKGFVELTVTWKNHMSEYISETTVMPKELVRDATGKMVLQEEMPKVRPVTHAADRLVNAASQNFVTKHSNSFPNELIIRQRHRLQIVPIAHCSYKWKGRSGNFCVYGFEHKVYFPDYPQQFCCGCSIL